MDFLNNQYIVQIVAVTGILMYVSLVYINYVAYKSRQGVVNKPLLMIVLIMVCVWLLPVLVAITALFCTIRQLVRLFLVVRHGSRFGGLFSGIDAIHFLKSSTHVVTVLITVKYNNQECEDFYTFMTKALHKIFKEELGKNVKIRCAVGECFGYSYLIRNEVNYKECLRKLKRIDDFSDAIDRSDLIKIIEEHISDPLPNNGSGLWEILIGTQRLKSEEKHVYPIVIRFNHGLMDGESIINLILGYFADRNNKTEDLNLPPLTLLKRLMLAIKGLLLNITIISLSPGCFLARAHKLLVSKFLNRPKLLNRTIVSFKTEESPRYIKIIKEIKNRVEGSTFSDIVLTAFCASLYKWLQKNSYVIPKCIFVGISSQTKIRNITKSQTFQPNVNLGNRYTMYYPLLPLQITNKEESSVPLTKQLQLVKHQIEIIRNTLDRKVNHFGMKVFGSIFPSWFTNTFADIFTSDVLFTNLPGIQSVRVFGGCPLQDFMLFLAHRERTGLGLFFGTYAQRVQLTFSVDAALISNQKDVNDILNGVFTHLDLLYNEVVEQDLNYAVLQNA